MAVPAFLHIPLHFFLMPESGRWLHSVGRFEESQKRLREIAKINKKDPCLIDFAFENENSVKSESISNVSVELFERKRSTQNSENVKKASLLDLFKTIHTSMLTLTCALTWFSCSLVFYGLAYSIGSIGGNLYINAYLLSSTESKYANVNGPFCLPWINLGAKKQLICPYSYVPYLVQSYHLLSQF